MAAGATASAFTQIFRSRSHRERVHSDLPKVATVAANVGASACGRCADQHRSHTGTRGSRARMLITSPADPRRMLPHPPHTDPA